ncbi:cytidine deaminase [Haladaptatus sp. DFWS20]|uniref:cytidine deaminase n=1 Tax=Haladaptatus sp. DFWS20 TaxID=3403467 RepID=UPI003EB84342
MTTSNTATAPRPSQPPRSLRKNEPRPSSRSLPGTTLTASLARSRCERHDFARRRIRLLVRKHGVSFDSPSDAILTAVTNQFCMDELVEQAREVQEQAHVPYSEYPVGAALRTADDTVFVGCNIENANYSNSLHAEEVAIAEAIKQGYREFDRLAVSSARRDGVTPCGMCRQTLAEFCDDSLEVVCDEGESVTAYTLGELLPNTITEEMLE